MLGHFQSRLAEACAFAACAAVYWLRLFPRARAETRRWHEHALSIPDERLRELALATQEGEQGNLEGAAAFAVLAPARSRSAVVRAAVAFQTAYDYVDTLAEETGAGARSNALRLHLVLLAALDERHRHLDLEDCRLAPPGEDGGYLAAVLEACREALRELPSYAVVRAACLRAATRMAVYQSLIHDPASQRGRLRDWSLRLASHDAGRTELQWWETAAGSASSLVVFALFAAAAQPALSDDQAVALERAYSPAVGALHVLLDSFADCEADARSGHHSLVSHYRSPARACECLSALAGRARAELSPLPRARRHQAMLAAMVGFYLSTPGARSAETSGHRAIAAAAGPFARPAVAVIRIRRAFSTGGVPAPLGRLRVHGRPGLLESQVVDFPLVALRAPQR